MAYEKLSKELHRQVIRNYPTRSVFSPEPNWIWSCDLIDYSKSSLPKYNDGFKYILVCVDVFSRFAICIKMEAKTGKAMEQVFSTFKVLPRYLWVDRGGEFYNKEMKKFCNDHNITMYSTYGKDKSCIAERFNRTLKTKIQVKMTSDNTFNWVDGLDGLVHKYNYIDKHRTIGMTPYQATLKENFQECFINQYDEKDYVKPRPKPNPLVLSKKKILKVGDYVRISRIKTTFEKGYDNNWSEEIFKVARVLDTIPVMYKLSEYDDTPIEGSFYRQELLKTKVDVENSFRVEKILKIDKKGKREFVKWLGWPKKYNSWIPAT